MGHSNPDSRSNGLPERRPQVEAPTRTEAKPAAVGSLMSVQIRRKHAPRKRAPCQPAPRKSVETPARDAASAPTRQTVSPATRRAAEGGELRRKEEIITYWTRLRGKRPYPAVSNLDPELIAAEWPNSIMFRCRAGSGALMPDMSFLPPQNKGRGGRGAKPNDDKIQLSPMMLQWLVSLAEDAVRNQRPVEDLESFPSARSAIGYRAIALPMSAGQSEIDHVLCHVKYA